MIGLSGVTVLFGAGNDVTEHGVCRLADRNQVSMHCVPGTEQSAAEMRECPCPHGDTSQAGKMDVIPTATTLLRVTTQS